MTLLDQLHALREDVGFVDRSDRAMVTVTGPETVSFLQSIVSQDIVELAVGASTHTLLLTPQGKLDTDIRLVRAGDEQVWLDAEPGAGAQLAESLNRFRIRVKADVADCSDEFGYISVRGPRAAELEAATRAIGDLHMLPVDWPTWGGFDAVGPTDATARVRDALLDACVTECGAEVYETLRIGAGVPRQGVDLDAKTIPQEAFLERDAVSFTKGCFLGQELVCRIDSRGRVNRFLRAMTLLGGLRPPRGAELVYEGKTVGSLTSVTPVDELPWLGLGYVRREVEAPAELLARWEGSESSVLAEPIATAS